MMSQHLKDIRTRFDALAQRERILLIVTVSAALWAIAHFLYLDPASRKLNEIQRASSQIGQDVTMLEARKTVLQSQIADGGIAALHAQLDELKRRRSSLDEALLQRGARLLGPEVMRDVLHDVLSGSRLKLHALRRLPVEVAYTTEKSAETAASSQNNPQAEGNSPPGAGPHKPELSTSSPVTLYRHSLEIELDGSYADMVSYLEKLESSGWQLIWQTLEIESLNYPLARMRLIVSTLSLRKEWIGV